MSARLGATVKRTRLIHMPIRARRATTAHRAPPMPTSTRAGRERTITTQRLRIARRVYCARRASIVRDLGGVSPTGTVPRAGTVQPGPTSLSLMMGVSL